MPGGDGKGPMGMGSMTGRAAGFCAGFGTPGYANFVVGRGFGIGFGRGRGARWGGFGGGGRGLQNMFYAAGLPSRLRGGAYGGPYGYPAPYFDPEMEKQTLKSRADFLESELNSLRERLSEIENDV